MSLVALASRQSAAAVKMAEAAVAAAPQMGTAWVALGQALKAVSRSEEAERAYGQAIRLDGMNALARTGLGELMLALGRPEAAIREFDLALRRKPALIAASMGLGHALTMMGRYEEALQRYKQVLAFRRVTKRVGSSAKFIATRELFLSPGGRARPSADAAFFSTPSRGWATPSNSAAMQPWSRPVAAM